MEWRVDEIGWSTVASNIRESVTLFCSLLAVVDLNSPKSHHQWPTIFFQNIRVSNIIISKIVNNFHWICVNLQWFKFLCIVFRSFNDKLLQYASKKNLHILYLDIEIITHVWCLTNFVLNWYTDCVKIFMLCNYTICWNIHKGYF